MFSLLSFLTKWVNFIRLLVSFNSFESDIISYLFFGAQIVPQRSLLRPCILKISAQSFTFMWFITYCFLFFFRLSQFLIANFHHFSLDLSVIYIIKYLSFFFEETSLKDFLPLHSFSFFLLNSSIIFLFSFFILASAKYFAFYWINLHLCFQHFLCCCID